MLNNDFFVVSYVWLFVKRVATTKNEQKAFKYEIIKLVQRAYSDVSDQVLSGS